MSNTDTNNKSIFSFLSFKINVFELAILGLAVYLAFSAHQIAKRLISYWLSMKKRLMLPLLATQLHLKRIEITCIVRLKIYRLRKEKF